MALDFLPSLPQSVIGIGDSSTMSEVQESDSKSPSHHEQGYVSAVLQSISSTAQVAYEQLPGVPSLTNTATLNPDNEEKRPNTDNPTDHLQTPAQLRQDMASAHSSTANAACKFHFVPHQAPAHSPAASSISPDQSTHGYNHLSSPTSAAMRSPPPAPVVALEPSPSESSSQKRSPSEHEAAPNQPAAHGHHASNTAPDASTASSTHEVDLDEVSDGVQEDFADASETLETPREENLPLTPREPSNTDSDSPTKPTPPDPSMSSSQSSANIGDQRSSVPHQSDISNQSQLDEPLSPSTHHHKKGKLLNKIVDLKEKVKVKLHK